MNDFWFDVYKGFFSQKKILLGITGSIAAFKSIEIIRLLKKCGAEVKVVLTESAEHFVTPLTLETFSENKVYTTLWDGKMSHIELARWADAILVAPATANTIAQLANGFADHLLSTEILAAKVPVFIAPAMNPAMLSHPATQINLEKLKSYHYHILEPEVGITACKEEGAGRMMEPASILENLASIFCAQSKQKTVLISMGPTRSYLDPIRYLTNRSSGKMGAALAFAAQKAGYHVEIITGASESLPLPKLAKITRVITTDDMAGAVLQAFQGADIFFSTAAVLDLEFDTFFNDKVKKDVIHSKIKFSDTVDILKTVGAMKSKKQFILGFAAETENLIPNAKKKLKAKNCDAVFVNPVKENQVGFESNQNKGILVTQKTTKEFSTQSKSELAVQILKSLNLD